MVKSWEPAFPNLGKWEEHSPSTLPRGPYPRYNCYALAAGDNSQHWEPDPSNQYYWPPNVPRAYSVPAFIEAYRAIGFAVCEDGLLEPRYRKIVIYANNSGVVQHVARQLSDGRWLSKLGVSEDIVHDTPQSLASNVYGVPVCYLKRDCLVHLAHSNLGALRFDRTRSLMIFPSSPCQ